MSFESLGLSVPVLQAVADKGYTEPTPIQEKAIPIVLMGRDVLGCAQTGTGKTASFVLPMIDILAEGRAKSRMPRTLILEPTRELAAQVAENFEIYGKNHKPNMAPEIRRLADRFLSNPKEVTVSPPASAGTNIVQGLVVVPEAEKREALRALIKSQELKNALVFCNRKRDVVTLHGSLKKHGINAGALHGDMSQPARM